MLANATSWTPDPRTFEEWFGVGDEGYKTKREAEVRRAKVDDGLKGSIGQVRYESTVTERLGYTGYWVHVVRTVDYNHPDRIKAGL